MNIETLREHLKTGVAIVNFFKVDGSMRVMRATLSPEFLPETEPDAEVAEEVAANTTTLAVWDVEAAGWRSMRIQNILSVDGMVFEKPTEAV